MCLHQRMRQHRARMAASRAKFPKGHIYLCRPAQLWICKGAPAGTGTDPRHLPVRHRIPRPRRRRLLHQRPRCPDSRGCRPTSKIQSRCEYTWNRGRGQASQIAQDLAMTSGLQHVRNNPPCARVNEHSLEPRIWTCSINDTCSVINDTKCTSKARSLPSSTGPDYSST